MKQVIIPYIHTISPLLYGKHTVKPNVPPNSELPEIFGVADTTHTHIHTYINTRVSCHLPSDNTYTNSLERWLIRSIEHRSDCWRDREIRHKIETNSIALFVAPQRIRRLVRRNLTIHNEQIQLSATSQNIVTVTHTIMQRRDQACNLRRGF